VKNLTETRSGFRNFIPGGIFPHIFRVLGLKSIPQRGRLRASAGSRLVDGTSFPNRAGPVWGTGWLILRIVMRGKMPRVLFRGKQSLSTGSPTAHFSSGPNLAAMRSHRAALGPHPIGL
jgi:hypothetical protein